MHVKSERPASPARKVREIYAGDYYPGKLHELFAVLDKLTITLNALDTSEGAQWFITT